ncbi:hypothetical protein EYF80_064585 [Liparis tanakae]|uniref:Uncharacterized protein n=1 Tax=Liparis tanakae TaxID=230148 RepID=A0A4Z2E8Y7_9TELE|nr:hypothetical protein EYF80_064585 [Liparis tanakae]
MSSSRELQPRGSLTCTNTHAKHAEPARQSCPDLSVPQDQEEEDGVSRVQVTSRRSPHKVERVSGLVTLSRVEVPKVSKAKQEGDSEWFPEHGSSSVALRLQKGSCC